MWWAAVRRGVHVDNGQALASTSPPPPPPPPTHHPRTHAPPAIAKPPASRGHAPARAPPFRPSSPSRVIHIHLVISFCNHILNTFFLTPLSLVVVLVSSNGCNQQALQRNNGIISRVAQRADDGVAT
eukprot:scaffold4760_cov113-Isochrysis_galbana.AAC.16